MQSADHVKCRTVQLADAAQTGDAARLLGALPGITVSPDAAPGRLTVHYTLPQHSLPQLLALLQQAGIGLASHPLHRLHYHLLCYCEQVQLDNLHTPPVCTKGQAAFCQLYHQHPHGDRDDTPEELRLEK